MGSKIDIWDIHFILQWLTHLVTFPLISITSKFPEAHWNHCCFLKDQTLPKFYPEKILALHRENEEIFHPQPFSDNLFLLYGREYFIKKKKGIFQKVIDL